MFEFCIRLGKIFIKFFEQGDLELLGLLDGGGFFCTREGGNGIAPWEGPLWETGDA